MDYRRCWFYSGSQRNRFDVLPRGDRRKTPPQLEVVVDSKQPSGNGFLVRFHIKNTGSQTAAAVAVEGELKNGEETVETSSSTLTYSPANSTRRGGLYFTKNPDQFNLQIRVTGYEEP